MNRGGNEPLTVGDFGAPPAGDFLRYPGERPAWSFILAGGDVLPLQEHDPLASADARLADLGAAPLSERVAVLCAGSNANPPQMAHKLRHAGAQVTPFVRGRVRHLAPVYAGHVSSYGAIPATPDLADDESELFMAFFTREQLGHVVTSEHGNYDFCRDPGTRFTTGDAMTVRSYYVFAAKKGVLILEGGDRVPVRTTDQQSLLRRVLERVRDQPGVPGFDEYVADPVRHRAASERAIGALGLRRRHDAPWQAVSVNGARTYEGSEQNGPT